jgi:hypothetical protein
MINPGRNDPCPCGSGKKYKNCCLNKDRVKRIRESAWRREEQVTLGKLIAFGQRPEFQPQLVVASNLFWNGNYGAEGANALDEDEIGRFLDWYLYDYRLEEQRKRVIDVFIEQTDSRLLPGERERVNVWSESYLSVYGIEGAPSAGILSVRDLLQGLDATVGDEGLGRLSLSGDLVLGRILRSSVPPHFSWAAILLPPEDEDGLVAFMSKAYGQYQEVQTRPSWPDFLSRDGYLFTHYLLRTAAEAGARRHTGGKYFDAWATVQKLGEVERLLSERAVKEAEERRIEEQHHDEKAGESLRQTRGGILLPGHVEYKGSRDLKQ